MLTALLILQLIDTTVPLWTLLICFVSAFGTGIWALVSMYFKGLAMKTEIAQLENKLDEEVNRVKELLTEHKESTSKNITELYKRIDGMRDLMIETNTYCKILLGDKIKK